MPTKIYSDEFKADALALVRQGMTRRQVCRDLGIAKSTLSHWESQVDAVAHGFVMPSDVDGQREAKVALKRIRELEQENEILRRAAAYLSQANLRNPK